MRFFLSNKANQIHWLFDETHALYRDSVGWYRKVFFLEELAADGQALLRFDATSISQEASSQPHGFIIC